MRSLKRLLIAIAALAIVTLVVALLLARGYMHATIVELDEPLTYGVPSGSSLSAVAADLNQLGVIQHPRIFSAWARINGAAQRIKAGEYSLEPGISPARVLQILVEGKVKLYPFTILEGWTFREIRLALGKNAALVVTLTDDDYANLLRETVSGVSHPEGWFFPETYHLPRGATDVELLRQANQLMATKLTAAWDQRATDLPLNSPYELLTLASIIERETAVDDERERVAGVFIRRLRQGMRLQTDPTVIYGLGEKFDGDLTRRDLLTDTPYNTYTRGGLPPTPIGMPSAASLWAAGHPDDSDALYFVASGEGDGRHIFSTTLEEHNAAVAAYIAQLRKANKARAAGAE